MQDTSTFQHESQLKCEFNWLFILIGCILNPGHGKIPAPDLNFYIQKDKYPI